MKKALTVVVTTGALAVVISVASASAPPCPAGTGGANAAPPAQTHGPFICGAVDSTPQSSSGSTVVRGCTVTANLPQYGRGNWWRAKGSIRCSARHRTLQMQTRLDETNGSYWVSVPNSSGIFYYAGGRSSVTGYGGWMLIGHGIYLRSDMYYNVDGQSGYLGGLARVS